LSPPSTVTKTGALIGTLAYMSPEQFRRQPLDARADQFSFCVALHEALYRRRPELGHLDAGADASDKSAGTPGLVRRVGTCIEVAQLGTSPVERLVQRHAKAELIGARVQRLAPKLLGRHVRERADER